MQDAHLKFELYCEHRDSPLDDDGKEIIAGFEDFLTQTGAQEPVRPSTGELASPKMEKVKSVGKFMLEGANRNEMMLMSVGSAATLAFIANAASVGLRKIHKRLF